MILRISADRGKGPPFFCRNQRLESLEMHQKLVDRITWNTALWSNSMRL
ncbi:hypothetical protein KNP414_03308 [Paenibacillus mucilaginosus KNP414]|uniref:Uncharacterized protein n=1 Tax=Paenibacillus mucilaginosus (strain KNP414) TaxID=1036673 RepID=F8FFE8_PAEMK|nr:hypothetical protein KNP414_03308 [Paenibacillus mucilaginosus KNP414]